MIKLTVNIIRNINITCTRSELTPCLTIFFSILKSKHLKRLLKLKLIYGVQCIETLYVIFIYQCLV